MLTPYDKSYFADKVAVVTGAASGVGLALVEELLSSGAELVVMVDVNQEHLTENYQRLTKLYPGKVESIQCDVTDGAAVAAMVTNAAAFRGRIDLLINNAGAGFFGGFLDQSQADWDTAFGLNYYPAVHAMQTAIPLMLKQGDGQIVNIISGVAFSPMPFQARYAATKAALHATTLALRAEFADDNIKLNSATPGTTATAIFEGHEPPPDAQTPQESACKILAGVVANQRIIFGSDGDIDGGTNGNRPDAQAGMDYYFGNVARKRRGGDLTAF